MPQKPKHFLVPVDGSETSLYAARYAWMLAQTFGARVTLLYVISHTAKTLTAPMQHAMKEEAKEAEAKLASYQAEIFENSPMVDSLILDGEVEKVISHLASQNPYDFVVIGSQGPGASMKRLFVGSVAKYVTTHVAKPVLVIDHPDSFQA